MCVDFKNNSGFGEFILNKKEDNIMSNAKLNIHRAGTRGYADHGWLKTNHTFSFASYYNPQRVQFGALRVLNDDIVSPASGFGTHPHNNMEIISIPIEGAIEHRDSAGNTVVIGPGEVQVMSAGRGVTHSEHNHSKDGPVNFLQIWILPNEQNVSPKYHQKKFEGDKMQNNWLTLVHPKGKGEEGLWIYQDAWLSMSNLEQGVSLKYGLHSRQNGVYFFVVDGEIEINGEKLNKRDGVEVTLAGDVEVTAIDKSKILSIEVPIMN